MALDITPILSKTLAIYGLSDTDIKEIADALNLTTLYSDYFGGLAALDAGSAVITGNLALNRNRILDFKTVLRDTLPLVTEIGGNFDSIVQMINQSTSALQRNVIFTPEIYQGLYAATKVLDLTVSELIPAFESAGIATSQITGNVEKSLDYIRSIGVDAKKVMGSIVENTDMLNRFSFKEGVLGMTKMAAQASILKTDMATIAAFADKVFEPEGAIEMASSFQRLGLYLGDLIDPFTLMDKSLNDPQGLIMSLAEAGQKFVQFNEEGKRFEINPSAIGQVRKIGEAAGTTAKEYTKIILSLAEFNERVGAFDFSFDISEEQKMFVANMAYLSKDGQYVVKIDGSEQLVTKLSKEQIEQIAAKGEGEESLVGLAKASLSSVDSIMNSVNAIKFKLLFGGMGDNTLGLQEDLRDVTTAYFDRLYESIPSISERVASNKKITEAFQEGSMSGVMRQFVDLMGIVGKKYMEGDDEFKQSLSDNKMAKFFIDKVEMPLKTYFEQIKVIIDNTTFLNSLNLDLPSVASKFSEAIKGFTDTVEGLSDSVEAAMLDLRNRFTSRFGRSISYSPSSRGGMSSSLYVPISAGDDFGSNIGAMVAGLNKKQQEPIKIAFTIHNKHTINGKEKSNQVEGILESDLNNKFAKKISIEKDWK
jgi:hypothetical protein